MSDIHILESNRDGEWKLVFHIPIAAANNSVPVGAGGPVPYRTAVAAFFDPGEITPGSAAPISVLSDGDGTKGTISAAEKAQLIAGEVVEIVEFFNVDSGGTSNAQRQTTVQARYQAKKTQVLDEVADRLKYYGAIISGV